MKISDVIQMALHNLWSRKLRTILNLVGVVVSCVILMMTLAGTRGVRTGLMSIINSSDEAKRFMIYPGFDKSKEPPAEAIQVEGQMSEDRRQRLQKRLRRRWLNKNARRTGFTQEVIEELRAYEHVEHVAVHQPIRFVIKMGEKSFYGSLNGAVGNEPRMMQRVVAGQTLANNDSEGVLLSEYTAYDLGFRTDEQLRSLIGKEIELSLILGNNELSYLASLANRANRSNIDNAATTIKAFRKLVDELDSTQLSDSEKKIIRRVFKDVQGEKPTEKIVFRRRMKVHGIVVEDTRKDLFFFLRMFVRGGRTNVLVDHREFERMNQKITPEPRYWQLTAKVDDIGNLKQVVDKLEAEGYQTHSIGGIIERMDAEIRKARLAISVIALLILVIVAIGISNTMVIAVLERTPEFGIMKAVGAKSSNILWLIIFEGALTGMIGALVSCAISLGLSELIDDFVRKYVSSRLRNDYTAEMFLFSPLDLTIVFLIAILICALASLLPAFRAARLDPVVAMRRN